MVYFLRISGSYADEFDVDGVHEITAEQAKFLMKTEGACFEEDQEICFGTNRYIELNELSVTLDSMSEADAVVVRSVLGNKNRLSYGRIDLSDVIREAMTYDI